MPPEGPLPDPERLRESLVERRIAEAMAEGEFDDLEGAGKPIPDLDVTYDPAWWAKKWIRRQRLLDRVQALLREAKLERRRHRGGDREAEARLARVEAEIARLNEQLPPADRL